MHKAGTIYLAAAMGCLALTMSCGGASGERPVPFGGSGGATGSGGASGEGGSSGSGGSGSGTGLDCTQAVTPQNGADETDGVVTDFTDWNDDRGKWGDGAGLYGTIYQYAGPSSSMQTATIEGSPAGLHLTGGVASNDYGGGGLGFSVCMTAADYTQIQFTIMGQSPGCDIELQIQTFDERPSDQDPPGGCDSDCYGFPVKKQAVDLSSEITEPQVVTVPLTDFDGWSDSAAKQVVGLQWQFSGTSVNNPDDGDTCPIDVTISDARFLP